MKMLEALSTMPAGTYLFIDHNCVSRYIIREPEQGESLQAQSLGDGKLELLLKWIQPCIGRPFIIKARFPFSESAARLAGLKIGYLMIIERLRRAEEC